MSDTKTKQVKLLRAFVRQALTEVMDGFGNKSAGKDGVAGNVRYDVNVRKKNGNILDDVDQDDDKQAQDDATKPHAACVLFIKGDGKILAVSRKDDPTDMGLPGGKVDEGEEVVAAAARELEEETGLTATNLKPVFSQEDNMGFITTTFMGDINGDIETEESGRIAWVTKDELLAGSFGEYNKALFDKVFI